MNSNNKLSLEMIQDDLEGLSKKLYLESPDLWMDFLDKTGNNKFDEMVLFFAVKHDFPNIIRYVVENNLIDLDKLNESLKNHYNIISRKMITEKEEYEEFFEFYSSVLKEINYPKYSDKIAHQIAYNFAYESDKYTFYKNFNVFGA